jgi:uncharacterized membrane protein
MNEKTNDHVNQVIDRNIKALERHHAKTESNRGIEEKIAEVIADFAGSMWSVYFHALVITTWLLVNTGMWKGVKPFDPYPFVILALSAALEAIFLATFVLANQNRMNIINEKHSHLDLQMSLLTEHELTRLIRLTDLIAKKLGVDSDKFAKDIQDLKKDVLPETVMDKLETSSNEKT